jgi:hypothetical protein
MATKLIMGTDIQSVNVTSNSDGGCPKQHAGIVPESFVSGFRLSLMADRDSITAMEERFAIREEGIF